MTDFLKKHEWMDPDNRVKNRPLRESSVIQDLDLAMRLVLLLLLLLPLQVVHVLLPLLVLLLLLLLLLLLRMSLSPRRIAEVALRVQGYQRGGKVCVGASMCKTLRLSMFLPR